MNYSNALFLAAFAALALPAAAEAGDWSNSAAYNGYGAVTQNTPSNFSLRDANGNLTRVNGQFVGSTYSAGSGAQSASALAGGVGMAGAGPVTSQATAIGNSLNVVVVGSHNTTVVDSTQINSGNQTATAQINSH
jgi:holdfast attachment protein HfaA